MKSSHASFMQTEMGNTGARHFGYEKAFVPVDASADFVFDQVSLTAPPIKALVGFRLQLQCC